MFMHVYVMCACLRVCVSLCVFVYVCVYVYIFAFVPSTNRKESFICVSLVFPENNVRHLLLIQYRVSIYEYITMVYDQNGVYIPEQLLTYTCVISFVIQLWSFCSHQGKGFYVIMFICMHAGNFNILTLISYKQLIEFVCKNENEINKTLQ